MSKEHESYQPPTENQTINDSLSSEEKNWGMACHIAALAAFLIPFGGSIAGPLIIWLLKRNESSFIDENGKEAVNFQITMAIAAFIAGILVFVAVGFVLLPIVGVVWLVLTIIGAVKASDGQRYKYPFALRLIN